MEENRLLIVEDDLATLYALRTLFERRGWRVRGVRTVAEALPAFHATEPDWVILDLYLPDGEGEEVLQGLRESGRPCRIAVASGVLEPERVAGLQVWSPDLVMAKPIDFVRLYSACIGIESALTSPDLLPAGYPPTATPSRRGQ